MSSTGLEASHWRARLLGIFRTNTPGPSLESEIVAGLLNSPIRTLPPRLLYDERGSALFDAICGTPEYYPTRTELKLLQSMAHRVAEKCRAELLIELGSGMARKTHVLLQAMGAAHRELVYVPVDVSEVSIHHSLDSLLPRFPSLLAQGVVGDLQTANWPKAPGRRRLVAFLGGTLGNFEEHQALAFLQALRKKMNPGDHLLLGVDLYKNESLLQAAYNDSQGLTQAFNLNLLSRLRHEFEVELEIGDFEHQAFFVPARSQIEMHLRARRNTQIKSARLGLELNLERGESIRSEISRKPKREELESLLLEAGFSLQELFIASPPYALALARV